MIDPSVKGTSYPPFSYQLERQKLTEFLLAIGEENPLFSGEDAALPPTFAAVFTFWGGGSLERRLSEMGVEIFNVLHAEQEYEYFKPMHIGDTITGQTVIADVYEKRGRSGEMQFLEFETTYTNQDSDRVLIDRATIIVRG